MENSDRRPTSGAEKFAFTACEVLLTGGASYLGSTVASALRYAGVLDWLIKGRQESIHSHPFYPGDIAEWPFLVNGDISGEAPLQEYTHLCDLASAHVTAPFQFKQGSAPAFEVVNVSYGEGLAVQKAVNAALLKSRKHLDVHVGPLDVVDAAEMSVATAKTAQPTGGPTPTSLQQGVADALSWKERWCQQQVAS